MSSAARFTVIVLKGTKEQAFPKMLGTTEVEAIEVIEYSAFQQLEAIIVSAAQDRGVSVEDFKRMHSGEKAPGVKNV